MAKLGGCTVYQAVTVTLIISWLKNSGGAGGANTPCLDCDRYNMMQQDQAFKDRQINSQCHYPCKCSHREIKCKAGVNLVKDGCDCCYMCARQQGDLCDLKDKCDEEKGLYCDLNMDDGLRGICRARNAKTCEVAGQIYRDGEEFKPDCRRLCTCQDGQYSCTTLCPQEDRRPQTCEFPRLIEITGMCCKEWSCPLPKDDSAFSKEYYGIDGSDTQSSRECQIATGSWSACSRTCGMGVSVRTTNDNEDCQPIQQRRLCLVRPCELNDKHLIGQHCKSTWKSKSIKIRHGDCTSIHEFRPKYCSTCKRGKCCGPGRTKTVTVNFLCENSRTTSEPFMWIKNCECHKQRRCPWPRA